jgi:nucleoid-associated protein YgaU
LSRESKIGLLVALAFLLVVGLLLSDQVTVATREAPAALDRTAESVRSSLRTPGVDPVRVTLPPEPEPEPVTPPAEVVVRVGTPPVRDEPVVAQAEHLDDIWDTPQETVVVPQPARSELADAAAAGGEPIVIPQDRRPEPQPEPEPEPTLAVTDYVAQPGDTLGRLTARAMGKDTAAHRKTIQALNPRLARNPDLIVVGRTYRLPASATASLTPRPAAATTSEYEVQNGDNLWKIAKRQLGDAGRRSEILALNKDRLPEPDRLKVGQKLRMPS